MSRAINSRRTMRDPMAGRGGRCTGSVRDDPGGKVRRDAFGHGGVGPRRETR